MKWTFTITQCDRRTAAMLLLLTPVEEQLLRSYFGWLSTAARPRPDGSEEQTRRIRTIEAKALRALRRQEGVGI